MAQKNTTKILRYYIKQTRGFIVIQRTINSQSTTKEIEPSKQHSYS